MILGGIFIAVFIIAGFLAIAGIVKSSSTPFEFMLRLLAVGLGFFVYFAARVSGLSVPSLLMLGFDNFGGFFSTAVVSIVPFIVGSLSSYILFKNIGDFTDENDQAVYFLLTFMTLVQFMFLDIYVTGLIDTNTGPYLLVNASFVIGIAGTILFNVDVLGSITNIVNSVSDESKPSFLRITKTHTNKEQNGDSNIAA